MSDLADIIKKNLDSDNKLTCKNAFKIAEELGIPPMTVGQECNRMGIKIKGCQLGCF